MNSTIEFTLSSPCPAHRDAILSWVVEGSESPSAAAAAEHVKRCAVCKEFRDSLKMQRVMVATSGRVAGVGAKVNKTRFSATLSNYVDAQLRFRSERSIAQQLWRIAESILRIESNVARSTFSEGDVRESLGSEASPAAHETRQNTELHAAAFSIDVAPVSRISAILNTISADLSKPVPPSLELRSRALKELAAIGSQLSGAVRGPMLTVLAYFEWFHGDNTLVPGLLDNALSHSATPAQRAHAVANLALWKSSVLDFQSAIRTCESAIQICPSLVFPRINIAVWSVVEGRFAEARQHFLRAASTAGATRIRELWPWDLLLEWLTEGLNRLSVNRGEENVAIARLWAIYCGGVGDAGHRSSPLRRGLEGDTLIRGGR